MATLVASCGQGVESRSCQSKKEGTFMRWTPGGSSAGFSKILAGSPCSAPSAGPSVGTEGLRTERRMLEATVVQPRVGNSLRSS